MRLTHCLATSVALALAAAAFAGDEADDTGLKLTIGDKAPDIDIAHWIKGEEVTEFEEGKIYVVEFWATWCGPCKASMPHLSELQEKLKDYDVTIIGVSNEPLQTVAGFLVDKDDTDKLWWDKIGYTLTTDPDRSVSTDYMKAAAQRFIPTAFVVGKEGHIEWIGSPRDIDGVLEQVVHDKWDRDAYKVKFERSLSAESKIKKLFNYLGPMNDAENGYAYGNAIAEEFWDDASFLNQVAWFVVDMDGIQTRNLEFAMKLANRANELTDSKDGAILDTVARVHYEMGDVDKALEYQRKAVEHSTPQFASQLKEALARYEAEAKAKRN